MPRSSASRGPGSARLRSRLAPQASWPGGPSSGRWPALGRGWPGHLVAVDSRHQRIGIARCHQLVAVEHPICGAASDVTHAAVVRADTSSSSRTSSRRPPSDGATKIGPRGLARWWGSHRSHRACSATTTICSSRRYLTSRRMLWWDPTRSGGPTTMRARRSRCSRQIPFAGIAKGSCRSGPCLVPKVVG